MNTLNKTVADDPDGIQNWVNQLDAQVMTRGQVVESMINAIADYKPGGAKYDAADATTKAAAAQFDNRVTVSNHTMDTVTTVDVNNLTPFTFKTTSNPDGGLNVDADATTVTSAEGAIVIIASDLEILIVTVDTTTATDAI